MNKRLIVLLFAMPLLLLASCGDKDEDPEYVEPGPTFNLDKVDSVTAVGGDGRIRLRWKPSDDPHIEYCAISWKEVTAASYNDSVTFPINRSTLDTKGFVSVVFNLPEGSYVFSLCHTGINGSRSDREEVTGTVYGDQFRSSLTPRQIDSVAVQLSQVIIYWHAPASNEAGSTIHYLNAEGQAIDVFVPSGESQTVLTNCKRGSEYTVTSSYLPAPDALDEFEVVSAAVELPPLIVRQNVALRKEVTVSDVRNADRENEQGYNAVDGQYNGNRWVAAGGDHWLEIDLGEAYTINGLKFVTGNSTGEEQEGYHTDVFEFQAWNGSDWDNIVTETSNQLFTYIRDFTPVTTSKVRFVTHRDTRLVEIEVYASVVMD
jgi:hypothetical protein